MKDLLTPALLFLFVNTGFGQIIKPQGPAEEQTLTATSAAKDRSKTIKSKPADQQRQSKAEQQIAETEYYFKKDGNNPVFYAANRALALGFSVNELGYKISPEVFPDKKTIRKNWVENIFFAGIYRGNEALLPNKQYSYYINKDELNYRYPGFSIQYINNEKGLRQKFIVNKKLAGTANLELLLKYKGPLGPSIRENGIEFSNDSIVKVFYGDLKVWDANKQILKTRFELREKNIIAIVVEDGEATYPITIE